MNPRLERRLKIAVFGGTGSTGQIVVREALLAGHDVVAFARDPGKLEVAAARLRVVEGQLTDEEAVERAVAGADAVISVLGPNGREEGRPLARGTARILAAMKRHGVRRIVLTTTVSAPDPLDGSELKLSLMTQGIKLLRRPAYDDILGIAEAARASDRDWTIFRVPWLTGGPKTGRMRIGYLGKGMGALLARANLGDFLVRQIEDPTWVRKAPMVCDDDAR